ncbi:MAG: SBBP repeat-containing protein [Bacteroidia bacterium]
MIFSKKYFSGVCLALLLSFSYTLYGQYWMERAGGSTIAEGYSISVDGSGNTYTTGYFSGTGTFGATNLSALGASDIFVTCTNSAGVFKWAMDAGSAGNECRGLAIAPDANGNVYVTGYYNGTATFAVGKTITSVGSQPNVFVAKYSAGNGSLQWVVSAGGTMAALGNAITVDNNNNVLITGQFAGTASFGSINLTSDKNNVNVFTAQLNPSGVFQWAEAGLGLHTDRGLGIGCDASGNVYVTGQFSDTITFATAATSIMQNGIFLIKYNNSGTEQWCTLAGGGSMNIANGIAVDASGDSYLTGNFTGTLSFFVSGGTQTLNTGKYPNGIFVAKYNSSGGLDWSVADSKDGPANSVTSNAISLDGSGNAYIIGNFECQFNSYEDRYGPNAQGIFISVGTWDIFVSEYAASGGAWQWSRQIGGHQDNLGYSIAVTSAGNIYTAGSFNQDMIITDNPPNYLGYSSKPLSCSPSSYCSDPNYDDYQSISNITNGIYDIFIAEPIDLSRQPYDFFIRTGTTCNRPVENVCVNSNPSSDTCMDSVSFCAPGGAVYANTHMCSQIGPDLTYKWTTGASAFGTSVTKTGWYSVTESYGTCLTSKDSIYVTIEPSPPTPTITNNLGTDTTCEKDITLTGGGIGAGSTYYWSNGKTTDSVINPITVDTTGQYCFYVKNKSGCESSKCVKIVIEDSISGKIEPGIICVVQTPKNCYGINGDSTAFCQGGSFKLFSFDSLTNPSENPAMCIPPGAPYVYNKWNVTPGSIGYSDSTGCGPNTFSPKDSGIWYHITDTIVRKNKCNTIKYVVKDSIYVTLYPIPTSNVLSISGPGSACPGDSVLLVVTGTDFTWKSPPVPIADSTADSIWVGPGSYSVSSPAVTNKYGCSVPGGSASHTVGIPPVPTIKISPTIATLCPGDSILLVCKGGISGGTYKWNKNGAAIQTGSSDSIYISTFGQYNCIFTDTGLCSQPPVSNTANIEQFSSPNLSASNQFLCPGGSVQLLASASYGSYIDWLPPLSGSDSSITITSPGTYYCKIGNCGDTAKYGPITIKMATPAASISPPGPVAFCQGDSVTLTGGPAGMVLYTWKPSGITSQIITVDTNAKLTLVTMDSAGCRDSATISINVTPNNIKPPLVADTNVCPGSTATLVAGGPGTMSWYLNTPSGTPVATGQSYTTPVINNLVIYYIQALEGGCFSPFDSIRVDTTNCKGEYIPNVFTPNGDGINDVFRVDIKDAQCFDGKIYNRWGVLVYQWSDALGGWDGIIQQTKLPASDGTYYYIIHYCNYLGESGTKDGFLTLIR